MMMDGIGEAIATAYMALIGAVFAGGVLTGWLLFSALPAAWPSIKQWIHAVSA